MAAQVANRLSGYERSTQSQRGNRKSSGVRGRDCPRMQQSMSNLKHRERSRPGRTMSPRPRRLNFISPSCKYGSLIFRGRSMFLATVTITSLAQTQQRSQKRRSHSTARATLKDFRLPSLTARMLKPMAKRLSMSQCLVTTSSRDRLSQKRGFRQYLMTLVSVLSSEEDIYQRLLSQVSRSNRKGRVRPVPQWVVAATKMTLRKVFIVTWLVWVTSRYSTSRAAEAVRGYLTTCHTLFHFPSLFCLALACCCFWRMATQEACCSWLPVTQPTCTIAVADSASWTGTGRGTMKLRS